MRTNSFTTVSQLSRHANTPAGIEACRAGLGRTVEA